MCVIGQAADRNSMAFIAALRAMKHSVSIADSRISDMMESPAEISDDRRFIAKPYRAEEGPHIMFWPRLKLR
jgi:hypothetical protein